MFDPGTTAADGNGNFGLQEENGGRLLSTGAFVGAVGDGAGDATACAPAASGPLGWSWKPCSAPYSGAASDWGGLVGNVTELLQQLSQPDYRVPLLPAARGYLRTRMQNGSLPQVTSAVATQIGSRTINTPPPPPPPLSRSTCALRHEGPRP
jgi:hypothetical protein